jgi:uncharacterized protein DUF3558
MSIVFRVATVLGSALLLSACTGQSPTPTASNTATSPEPAAVPHSGAPKVESPLPASTLEGSPCDTAFTSAQLAEFLGEPTPPERSEDALGQACSWTNTAGTGVRLQVGYQTKSDQGLSLAFQNVKPKAARWVDLDPVQTYPAVGYVDSGGDPSDKRQCVVVVGVSDQLAYSVGLILGDGAAAQGKDACAAGREAADAVLTNLKARA